jgi:hypothetical protein
MYAAQFGQPKLLNSRMLLHVLIVDDGPTGGTAAGQLCAVQHRYEVEQRCRQGTKTLLPCTFGRI